MRELLTQQAVARYASGKALASEIARKNIKAAGRWILRKCAAEMRATTEYCELYRQIQAEYRAAHPFIGLATTDAYAAYLRELGHAVVTHPDLQAVQAAFMKDAIPRWAARYHQQKDENPGRAVSGVRPGPLKEETSHFSEAGIGA